MALSQSALSELLEVFRAGEGVDLIREAVRVALQELIEIEATEVIGAGQDTIGMGQDRDARPDTDDRTSRVVVSTSGTDAR